MTDQRPATRFEDLDPDPLTVAWREEMERRRPIGILRSPKRRWHPALAVTAGIIASFLLGFVVASLSSRTEARAVQSQTVASSLATGLASFGKARDTGHADYRPRVGGATSLSGWATWYDVASGHAAAGPALRTGDWRGRIVTVCAKACVIVRLTDWCACASRHGVPTLIDLARADFARLAPLSQGVVKVTISSATLPATDTELTP